jgi:hypothetical protein
MMGDDQIPRTETSLPVLSAALERRYRGVRVKCARVMLPDGQELLSSEFVAHDADLLVRYGLARRKGSSLTATSPEAETFGGGLVQRGDRAYVLHNSVDGDHYIGGRFGYAKTRSEFARIWLRMKAPKE